jgi:hypothetical protein
LSRLQLKLIGIFVGAPLALAAEPLGQRWLFFVGITLLVVVLVIPAQPGQALGERLRELAHNFPILGRLGRKD